MERKLTGVWVWFCYRNTNLIFPNERSSDRHWKRRGVDIAWEEGFSDPMIKDWLKGITTWAESVGIQGVIVVRFGWDATDILKRLSHNKDYAFQGDHNPCAPFIRDNLTFTDVLPDPAILQEAFKEVMVLLDTCKETETTAAARLACLQKVRSYLKDPDRVQLLQTQRDTSQEKATKKRKDYEAKNKKRGSVDPSSLSPQQKSALWHFSNKADKLGNILQSSARLAKEVEDLGNYAVGKEDIIAELTKHKYARDIIITFTDACRHACSKFYSFRLQCTNAKDSSAVCRMRVASMPEGAIMQICDKVAEKVHNFSNGKVQVKMLSADGEGLTARKGRNKPTTLHGLATQARAQATQVKSAHAGTKNTLNAYLLQQIKTTVHLGAAEVASRLMATSEHGPVQDINMAESMTDEEFLKVLEGEADSDSDSDDNSSVSEEEYGLDAEEEDPTLRLLGPDVLPKEGEPPVEDSDLGSDESSEDDLEPDEYPDLSETSSDAGSLNFINFSEDEQEHEVGCEAMEVDNTLGVPNPQPQSAATTSGADTTPAATAAATTPDLRDEWDIRLDMSSEDNFQGFLETISATSAVIGWTSFQAMYNITFAHPDYIITLEQEVEGMKAGQLVEELAQALMFKEIKDRCDQGDEFLKYYYVVEEYYVHIDYQHKMKNELAKQRKQAKEKGDDEDDPENPVLINLPEMLQVVEDPENPQLKHLQAALSLAADSQSVVIAQECFYNRDLQRGLMKKGYMRTACALRVLADAHMAWDMPGLRMGERRQRLERARRLYVRLLGKRMYTVSGTCTCFQKERRRQNDNLVGMSVLVPT